MMKELSKSLYYGFFSLIAVPLCIWLILSQDTALQQPKPSLKPLDHWNTIGHFHIPRRAFAAANTQQHIYVLGGIDINGQYLSTVEFATIHPDGSLGQWKTTTALNEGRFYLSAVIIGDYLYAIGGANGPLGDDNLPSASVERAKILANGELGSWKRQAYLTTPRRGLQAVAYKNYIYALGGYNGQFLKTVERAQVNQQGEITHWIEEKKNFLVDRYIHSAAIHEDRIYLIAGHVEKQDYMSYADVESAQIQADGQLTPWKIEATTLNTPRFIASSVTLNDHLYIAGGHDGANRLTSVEAAPIMPNGSIGQWQYVLPLNMARSATMLLAHKNSLYVLGGAGGEQLLNSIEYSQQLPNGKLMSLSASSQPSEQ